MSIPQFAGTPTALLRDWRGAIGCRQYDCRMLWLAGLRCVSRGLEVNKRLASWRTEVNSDVDRGIVAIIWVRARELHADIGDVGLSAAGAAALALAESKESLRAIGRQADVRKNVPDILRLLNNPPSETT